MHASVFPDHEKRVERIALELGFNYVYTSASTAHRPGYAARASSCTANAYLTPKLKDYIGRFLSGFDVPKGSDFSKRVHFMRSDGGLSALSDVVGAEAVMSGPAGGVVGYAKTAYDATSKTPIIGFDMGGTSTDVSRFDGVFRHVFEVDVAGISLSTPQLDIQTVAAGGGSRLFFRNGLFVIGPESAGACPGPACYRRDGPLTVTDANLVLGRLLVDEFPKIFGPNEDESLDRKASIRGFEEIALEVNAHLATIGKPPLNIYEIALGFIKVANETMARPIRTLTEQRGYAASSHALACFGGAGGQHACAIARSLGMKEVVVHRYASVLSAFGIGLADVVFDEQEPCAFRLKESESDSLIQERMERLQRSVADRLNDQGCDKAEQHYEVYISLRYQGTDTPMMVAANSPISIDQIEKDFIELHRVEFGFSLENRAILVDAIRVRGRCCSPENATLREPSLPCNRDKRAMIPKYSTKVYFDNLGLVITPVYSLDDVSDQHEVPGPAILVDKNTTMLIEPDCVASVSLESVRIQIGGSSQQKLAVRDPIMTSIFGHRFMGIAEQMGQVLRKTAISTNIKERLDFSCALFGPDGSLVANAPHIPVHLGGLSYAVIHQLEHYGPFEEGDVILTNHPACGGSHLPDMTMITPVFYQGQLVFFTASRAHHADIGGILPGSMPPNSKWLFEEGAAIKSFKIIRGGAFDLDGVRKIFVKDPAQHEGCSGARIFRDTLSDLHAQIAANWRGVALMQSLIKEFGVDTVLNYMQYVRESADLAVRNLLRRTASKYGDRLSSVDYMDDGSPIRLNIVIDSVQGTAVFDFHGTGPQVFGNWNAPKAITYSAIIYCLRCLVDEDIPLNQGCLEPITVMIPPNSLLSPSDDAAVVGGNVLTSQRLVDVILKAFSACAASQGDCNNFTFGVEASELDGVMGWGYYETIAGGAGAGPSWHGTDGVHSHMTNTRITDPEILEARYPVVLRQFSLRDGSGGSGQYHGGKGVIREIEFTQNDVQVSLLTERRVLEPYGLEGGENGKCGMNIWIKSGSHRINVGGKNTFQVQAGDCVRICTPGGGGWGIASSNTSSSLNVTRVS